MEKLPHYLLVLAGSILSVFLAWYFSDIVAYILISAVLSLMAKPLVDFMSSLHINKWKFPRSLAAATGLLSIWLLFYLFFYIFIPLITSQAEQLSNVNIDDLVNVLTRPLEQLESVINATLPGQNQFLFKDFLDKQLGVIFDINLLRNSFGSITNFLISMMVAAFAISFITFFFMKEDGLFTDGILILFPSKYEAGVRRALESSTRLLVRYFIGVVLDMTCVMVVLTIGLSVFTLLDFRTSLIIGLIAGILNVIPYVGPVVSAAIGVLIALATNINLLGTDELSVLFFSMCAVFVACKVIDDAVFQPYIFSSSVRAHPLEIFLLILIAGNLAGIGGMLLAIPAYTVLRVFAKEFFNTLRFVQRLTEKI